MSALLPHVASASAAALPSVLLVEEHDEMRSALRDWLLTSFPPMRLREARNLEEALGLVGQGMLDLALVNLELPGANGIEAARTLRRRCPALVVVVMSVNDSEALRLAALSAGADAFLSKRDLRLGLLPLIARVAKR